MPKKKWIALAIMLGISVGGVILGWPARPLWTQSISPCHELIGFTDDGTSLVVSEGLQENRAVQATRSLVYYDLPSGREQKRVQLNLPDKTFFNRFWLSPEGKTLMAMTSRANETDPHAFSGPTVLCSFDVATGRQLNRLPDFEVMHEAIFSLDRKWFVYTKALGDRSDFSTDFKNLKDVINIVSTDDFRVKYSIPYDPTIRQFHEFCFFGDESKLAILWMKWPGKPLMQLMQEDPKKLESIQQMLEVLDLQSGKVINSFAMPATHRWIGIVKSTKGHIHVQGCQKGNDSVDEVALVTFKSENSAMIAPGPTLSSHAVAKPGTAGAFLQLLEDQRCELFGEDWVVHSVMRDRTQIPNSWIKAIQWIDSKCGTAIMNRLQPDKSIRITDRHTGSLRLEAPTEMSPQLLMNSDGQYLALAGYEKPGLQLWNANPGSRWPYAIVAGLLTMMVLSFLMRRKSQPR